MKRMVMLLPCLLCGLLVTPLLAGEHNDVLNIGDSAPKWNLPGVDGKSHAIDEYRQAKLVLVVFSCNSCPAARSYESRIKKIASDFKKQGVQVVAIHVHRDESLADATEYAKQAQFNYPYLHDGAQQVAKSYGAKTTPHVFVLDQNRKIAYMGAVDDNMNEDKVQMPFLRDAVKAILAGQQPGLPETLPFGCSVKWK